MEERNKLRDFAHETFGELSAESGVADKSKLKVINNNIFTKNGAHALMGSKKVCVLLNANNLIGEDTDKTKINIYKTLSHEIDHIKFHFSKNDNLFDYNYLIGTLEKLYFFYLIKKLPLYRYKILSSIKKNSDCSLLELSADYVAYIKTFEKFQKSFDKETLDFYKQTINSIKLLLDNLEIFYGIDNIYMNRFYLFFMSLTNRIKKDDNILIKNPILNNIFESDGKLKDIYELYQNINPENEDMYKRLIINYFTTFNIESEKYFEDLEFKKYIEKIFNEYIANTINYYNNIQSCLHVVNDRRVLFDNLKMMKRNVAIINKISREQDLTISGDILDSETLFLKRTKK